MGRGRPSLQLVGADVRCVCCAGQTIRPLRPRGHGRGHARCHGQGRRGKGPGVLAALYRLRRGGGQRPAPWSRYRDRRGSSRQFAVNPSYDDMDAFGATLHELGVRSVRMAPEKHRFPFRDWVVGPWLEWLASEKLPLWLDSMQFDPVDLHDTAKNFPDTRIVLSEVHYSHVGWAIPILKSLPNLSIEISRFLIPDGVNTLIDAIGHERVLFGSRFPDSPMAPMLYSLHRSDLSEEELRAICSGNLERLLAGD